MHFYIVFKPSKSYLEIAEDMNRVEKVTEKVTENQRKILEFIGKDRFVTTKKLSKFVGISDRKIKSNIAKLKQKNFLKRIGSAKGGHWEVLE